MIEQATDRPGYKTLEGWRDPALPLALNVGEAGEPPELPPEPTLREAVFFLDSLVSSTAFLDSMMHALPELAQRTGDWHVSHRQDAPDGSHSLQVFVWPPGSATRIHDHSSWGAFCCVAGSLSEERYERLDDGARPDQARLRKLWRRVWEKERGISTVLPHDGGVHRVGNPGEGTAVSVHLYGPRMGEIDGRDYDLSPNHVCDRRD